MEAVHRVFCHHFKLGCHHPKKSQQNPILSYTRVYYTAEQDYCVYAVSSSGVIRPFFYNEDGLMNTVTVAHYVTILKTSVTQLHTFSQMTDNGWFQHEGSMSHTA